jgi:mannosyltransferase OCH1-like enzyme
LDFVRREFPEYLDAYRRLRKDVERSDFFRYMVVLRLGGVYADIDTECRQPMDSLIRSKDTLIVGWENEFPDPQAAVESWYVRTRQVLQWVFAGAAGHPALREVCDRIAGSVRTTFSSDPNLDILEKTGPGVFTDVVLRHAARHPPSNVSFSACV